MSIVDDCRAIAQAQQQISPQDHDLVGWLHRIAAGDQAAFALLYDALSGDVRRLAGAAFADTRAVDAIVAAIFLQVWRLAPLPDPALARDWVTSAASSLIAQRQNIKRHSSPSGHPATYWPAPWAAMSSICDESVGAVLASRLNRRSPRESPGRRQS
jgi:DNA-directed RNA polymerase specialized sigma24 family protein